MNERDAKNRWLELENSIKPNSYFKVDDALNLIEELREAGYTKERYIFFHLDTPIEVETERIYRLLHTTKETREAIYEYCEPVIQTTDLTCLSFDLIMYGYRIFISDGTYCFNLRMHHPGIVKDLRYAHNVNRILCAGDFNYMLPGLPDIFPDDKSKNLKPIYNLEYLTNYNGYI